MTQSTESIDALNDLIQMCCDGEKGFKLAAEAIEERGLQDRFLQYSNERGAFASQLKTEVERLGGDPAQSGTIRGAVHRGWLKIRDVVSSHSTGMILEECERGENAAIEAYAAALAQPIPTMTRELVQSQLQLVREAHSHLSGLKSIVQR